MIADATVEGESSEIRLSPKGRIEALEHNQKKEQKYSATFGQGDEDFQARLQRRGKTLRRRLPRLLRRPIRGLNRKKRKK